MSVSRGGELEDAQPMTRLAAQLIEIVEPDPDQCPTASLPPEGNVKLRNYRMLSENLRAYTPTGDVHTSPIKGKLMPKFDVGSNISPPRAKILELLRPDDPGRDALEAIVRPAPRRGLARPLDDDTRRFLQRALLSPSPQGYSAAGTPEPDYNCLSPEPEQHTEINESVTFKRALQNSRGMSLADELKEAEEGGRPEVKSSVLSDVRRGGTLREAVERERMGRLALAVEEDEPRSGALAGSGLEGAARRLDALLAESRELQATLAAIHDDMQTQCARACRCAGAARALAGEWRAMRFLDDVLALLRGDVSKALRAQAWPFALGNKQPGRNYVV